MVLRSHVGQVTAALRCPGQAERRTGGIPNPPLTVARVAPVFGYVALAPVAAGVRVAGAAEPLSKLNPSYPLAAMSLQIWL